MTVPDGGGRWWRRQVRGRYGPSLTTDDTFTGRDGLEDSVGFFWSDS